MPHPQTFQLQRAEYAELSFKVSLVSTKNIVFTESRRGNATIVPGPSPYSSKKLNIRAFI